MPPKLAMIHTIAKLVPVFEDLCDELLPDVHRFHIADEAAHQMLLTAQDLTPAIYRRLSEDVVSAEAAGADVILFTCSSSSPCVDVIRHMISVPLVKIDEPMVDRAISMGKRIGIAATAATTVKPTAELIAVRSKAIGKETQIEVALTKEAHRAMLRGNLVRHDQLVRDSLARLMEANDVIVLAQVSMAHVAEQIAEPDRRVPILSSPRLALERIRMMLH